MPASGKVSLTRQTIYCFIPVLDLYAAYKIKKFRWYFAIMITIGIALSVMASFINPPVVEYDAEKILLENNEINWEYAMLGENPELSIAIWVVNQAISIAVTVYLIRRWSKQWNLSFN